MEGFLHINILGELEFECDGKLRPLLIGEVIEVNEFGSWVKGLLGKHGEDHTLCIDPLSSKSVMVLGSGMRARIA